jgi:hypothetical protein
MPLPSDPKGRMFMSRTAIVFAILALICGTAVAGGVSVWNDVSFIGTEGGLSRAIIDSFLAPGTTPLGIDWVEGRGVLYHVDEWPSDVYSITPDGTATFLFNALAQLGFTESHCLAGGVCYVETSTREAHLYITDKDGHVEDPLTDRVFQFTLDGTLVNSWDIESICDGVIGICFDGSHFWLSSYTNGQIVKCNADFQQVAVYPHPMGTGGSLDYDPETGYYYVTDFMAGMIYVCDAEMNQIAAYSGPTTGFMITSLAVGRTVRGRTLWCSGIVTGPFIFEIDDDYYNPVEKTTWGSIKAQHR